MPDFSASTYAEEVAARLRSLGLQATNWRAVVEISPADAERLANLLERNDAAAKTGYHIRVEGVSSPGTPYEKLYDGTSIHDALAAWSKGINDSREYVMLEALRGAGEKVRDASA
jgi:hypothetical protein